jgi:hypothetical protein
VYAADAATNSIQEFDSSGVIIIKQTVRFYLPTVNLGDHETTEII